MSSRAVPPFFALAFALLAALSAEAQTATVFGSLSNFDVVNNTEYETHGFEIELEGGRGALSFAVAFCRRGIVVIGRHIYLERIIKT